MKKIILSIVTLLSAIGLHAQHNYDNQNTIYSLNGNVGVRITSPGATLDVPRGNAGGGTAMFRGTNRISHFNFSTNEDTYIRGGKVNSNVFLNDNGGNVGVRNTNPQATIDVSRGNAGGGTAMFRGTNRTSHFSYSIDEHTYIRGGKLNSNVFLNDNGGNVGIRNTSPIATLDVSRGNAGGGTAMFRGTNRISHFSYSTDEHTYIRGGKSNSSVFLNDNGGNVGIGTTNTRGYKLAVNGKIRAKEIVVEASPWPDFVFKSNYNLLPLKEVAKHIKTKGHLPNIPTENEVHQNGISLGTMNAKLLQKIEELTLYTIQQEDQLNSLQEALKTVQAELKDLKKQH